MQAIAQTTTTIVRNCYNKSMEYSVVGVVAKKRQSNQIRKLHLVLQLNKRLIDQTIVCSFVCWCLCDDI